MSDQPWLVWLRGLGIVLQTERSLVSTHVWGVGRVPGQGRVRGN